ncbi:MAG: hypothetical protein Q8L04_04760 [Ignavibacteria bacterium]|nr:hypothetical protein [Ignavibacteria bacterium]
MKNKKKPFFQLVHYGNGGKNSFYRSHMKMKHFFVAYFRMLIVTNPDQEVIFEKHTPDKYEFAHFSFFLKFVRFDHNFQGYFAF